MKFYGLLLAGILLASSLFAQNKIESTGNVGIGTTTPAQELVIKSSRPNVVLSEMDGNAGVIEYNEGTNQLRFQHYINEGANFQRTMMTLNTSNGFVGIGTDSPLEVLHVNGKIRLNVANNVQNQSPGLVVLSNSDFLFDGEYINHYGIGFHQTSHANGTAPFPYISGFYGIDFFTGGNHKARINSKGLGIGTLDPQRPLHVQGDDILLKRASGTSLHFRTDGSNSYINNMDNFVGNGSSGNGKIIMTAQSDFYFRTGNSGSSGTSRMVINNNGNVGIGTETPSNKLDVNGTIHAKEVVVDLNFPGPDYVFEDDYPLRDLNSIEKYIKENKHLPEVPSAAQMEKEGVNMMEMQMLLLKKVEELTLHIIKQQEEINQLKESINK